jgi:hypothetical protein
LFEKVAELYTRSLKKKKLLKLLRRGVVHNQVLKDGKHVLAIFDDALKHRPQLRLLLRFFVPLRKNRRWDGNIPPQLVGRVAAHEQAVKKRGFALRELKFLQHVF